MVKINYHKDSIGSLLHFTRIDLMAFPSIPLIVLKAIPHTSTLDESMPPTPAYPRPYRRTQGHTSVTAMSLKITHPFNGAMVHLHLHVHRHPQHHLSTIFLQSALWDVYTNNPLQSVLYALYTCESMGLRIRHKRSAKRFRCTRIPIDYLNHPHKPSLEP
ncbi:hypothetical protein LXL04_028632 [Taraxacum kok-saghyz]